jgi:uncharacterized OsmC-like protein
VARASNLAWRSLDCYATGTLERVEGVTRFTKVHLHASLAVPPEVDHALAERFLQKAEDRCLVSRSLNAEVHLETCVTTVASCCDVST